MHADGSAPRSEISAATVFSRQPGVSLSRFGDEGLLVIARSAEQAVLNDTATRILELVDGQRRVADIARAVQDEYEIDDLDQATRDVVEILTDLEGRGAVAPAAQP